MFSLTTIGGEQMVRISTNPHNGEKEFVISTADLDFFGELMGRVARPQLPAPAYQPVHQLPDVSQMSLPVPPQHLLMPAQEYSLPEPDPRVMPPRYTPAPTSLAIAPIRIAKPSLLKTVIGVLLLNKRYVAMGGIALVGGLFLLFAGSFIVRKIAPEKPAAVEAPAETKDGEAPEASAESAPPAEAPAPAPQVPTFPSLPQ